MVADSRLREKAFKIEKKLFSRFWKFFLNYEKSRKNLQNREKVLESTKIFHCQKKKNEIEEKIRKSRKKN